MNDQDLPSSWLATNLGTVVEYGKTRKAEPEEIEDEAWILELEDIERDTSRVLSKLTYKIRQSKSTKNRFEIGDVLYGKLRPYLNKVVIADQAGYCTTEIIPIDGKPFLENRFIFYWLKHPAFLSYVESASHGLNMPRLGTETGKVAPFVLAPRQEQKRIADKLDALLMQVDACRNRLDKILGIIKRFRQAVLGVATSGQLTQTWRKNKKIPDWQQTTVDGIATKIFDGPFGSHLKTNDYSNGGIRVIRLENIGWMKFIHDKETFITQEKYNSLKKHTLYSGDVVFSSFIDEEIRVSIFPEELGGYAINKSDCFSIRIDRAKCLPKFLELRLACKTTYTELAKGIHGATRPRINLTQLKAYGFELPPIPEQAEIVRRVETLFAFADRLEARYTAARAQVENLTPALLAKAFRGELVPQDPNDEPASALLARIQAQRAAPAGKLASKPKASTTRRSPKGNSTMTKSRQDSDVKNQPYLANHLRRIGGQSLATDLFKAAELPVADFYKQLAWEINQGYIQDNKTTLEASHAA